MVSLSARFKCWITFSLLRGPKKRQLRLLLLNQGKGGPKSALKRLLNYRTIQEVVTVGDIFRKDSTTPQNMVVLLVCMCVTVTQLFTFTWLLSFDGFCHIMDHYCLQIFDFAKLRLLLSVDIEQNPGPPLFYCRWEGCSVSRQSISLLCQRLINNTIS